MISLNGIVCKEVFKENNAIAWSVLFKVPFCSQIYSIKGCIQTLNQCCPFSFVRSYVINFSYKKYSCYSVPDQSFFEKSHIEESLSHRDYKEVFIAA